MTGASFSDTSPALRIGVDVGGTFTDVVAYDERAGTLASLKVPTIPEDQASGVMAGIDGLLGDGQIDAVVHGTTAITNALLEGRGASVALVTTRGFRDALEIARLAREGSLYELVRPGRPEPPVPRHRRLEVAERIRHDGSILGELTEGECRRIAAQVGALDVEAVAVCLLHSYANPEHERALKAVLADVAPHVCVSSEINAEFREYERTSTTVLNASVMPIAARYMARLVRALGVRTTEAPLHIVQSSGGMMSARTAAEQPLRMVMSGPAAGVAAAQYLLRHLDIPNAVTFDMGGTSTDVCLIWGGVLSTVRERKLSGWPVRVPSVAVESIGAGGGSVAWVDATGALRVGPRSAAAHPGPAAYGLGGEEPTVTDANVVLGLIRDGLLLGRGAIRVDRALAEEAVGPMAESLGLGLVEAARGIVEVANANMLRAIRLVSVQRGVDPRDLTLVAYGGAGPLHATRLAQTMGMPRVLVPAYSSAFSALGCLVSELRYDVVRTFRRELAAVDQDELGAQFAELEAAARAPLEREGHGREQIVTRRGLDLRYAGQNYELEVPLDDGVAGLVHTGIRQRFYDQHRALYTYATDEAVECVTLRVAALVPSTLLRLPRRTPNGPARLAEDHPCTLPGLGSDVGKARVTVYGRSGLGVDEPISGPALIEDEQSTTVILAGQTARADALGNLFVEVPT